MSDTAQDLAVETEVPQDVTVETPEAATEDTDTESPDVVSEESEQDLAPVETVEEKVARLERETAGKQKAIDRKTAAYHDLQKALDKQRREFEVLQQTVRQTQPNAEPVIDDFETHEEFDNARIQFHAERLASEKQREQFEMSQRLQEQQASQERAALVQQQENEYLAVNPNYGSSKEEFFSFVKTANVAPEMERAIVDRAIKGGAPELINYFGSNNGENLGELQKILTLTPVEAGVEIYKIQQGLKTLTKKESKPVSAPAQRPKGGGNPKKNLHEGDVLKNLGLK